MSAEKTTNGVEATSNAEQQQKQPNYALINSIPNIAQGGSKDLEQNIRIENFVGFAQVPLGVAGPLTIHGENQKGTLYAPLATVEPTLVASCSRGCKAFERSGGIHAVALQEGMSRAPVFRFANVTDSVSFYRSVPSFESELRSSAEATSGFAKLQKVIPHILGKDVHVKFLYTCGDAAGQNMTTIATHAACQRLIGQRGVQFKIVGFMLEGQLSSDKKISFIHVHEPRGVQVLAWGTLNDEVCRSVLGSSAARIHDAINVVQQGAVRAGMMGSNINVNNVVAAMFIACGQDAASVLESGWAQLCSEYDTDTKKLTLSLFIPSLAIGSVGGGTMYTTQKEALEMVMCAGKGKKWALAETIASFALALDISTISAVCDDTFANSHKRFARSSKI